MIGCAVPSLGVGGEKGKKGIEMRMKLRDEASGCGKTRFSWGKRRNTM